MKRKLSQSDETDEEWKITGALWCWFPHDFPERLIVSQQTQRWIAAGCFEASVHDFALRLVRHQGRKRQPSAMILDSRTLQSTSESGARAGTKEPNGAQAAKCTLPLIRLDTS